MNGKSLSFAVLIVLTVNCVHAQDGDQQSLGNESAYEHYVRTGETVAPGLTFAQLSASLTTYDGLPLDVAIRHFGYPDTERDIAGQKLYIWEVSEMVHAPDVAFTNGKVGDQSFSATTYGNGSDSVAAHCKVTMEVDDKSIVKDVVYQGNMLGCARFLEPAHTASISAQNQVTFADLVAEHEKADGGKPLSEAELDTLRDQVWAQEERGSWSNQMTEQAIEAEKLAFDTRYVQWKVEYLKQHSKLAADASVSNQGDISPQENVLSQFNIAIDDGNLRRAKEMLNVLENSTSGELRPLQLRLAKAWLDQAEQQLDSGDRASAILSLDQARHLAPDEPRVTDLGARLQNP